MMISGITYVVIDNRSKYLRLGIIGYLYIGRRMCIGQEINSDKETGNHKYGSLSHLLLLSGILFNNGTDRFRTSKAQSSASNLTPASVKIKIITATPMPNNNFPNGLTGVVLGSTSMIKI